MTRSHTKSADEVLTNHASETGRWVALCAFIESREDFADFSPADAPAQTTGAMAANVLAVVPPRTVGNAAPLAVGGAASGGAR